MAGPYAFRTKQGEEIHGYLCDIARRLKRGDVVVVILGYRSEDTMKFVEHLQLEDAHVAPVPSTSTKSVACTTYIQRFPLEKNLHYKSVNMKRLIVVKTPGIDALGLSDTECLEEFIEIASPLRLSTTAFRACFVWIVALQTGPTRCPHTGGVRFPSHTALLSQVTGGGALSCALFTTRWGAVPEDVGHSQERDLCRILWGDEEDGALAFRLSDDHPKESVGVCLDALIAKLAVEGRSKFVPPAMSVFRWLSGIRTKQAKEPGTEGATSLAPPTRTMRRPFRLSSRSRTLSSGYSSRSPSLYITPPTSPVEGAFAINQPRPHCVSGLRNALHTDRFNLGGELSLVEVATDGGSSWVEGDRVSSEGMGCEPKVRHSLVENLNSSGKWSNSWEDCGGDVRWLSLCSSGSWGEVRDVVWESGGDDGEESHEGHGIFDTFSEQNDDDPNNGSLEKLKRSRGEGGWPENITELSGETEWPERGGASDTGCPSLRKTSPGPTHLPPKVVIGQLDISSTAATTEAPSTPHTGGGPNTDPSPSELRPPPLLPPPPSPVINIALPVELLSHNGSLSSMTSFSSGEGIEGTTAPSSNGNGNGGGTNYFGGASHFGVKNLHSNVVNLNLNLSVNVTVNA